jgi:multicomponent Na+:H+ antiporter subunit A
MKEIVSLISQPFALANIQSLIMLPVVAGILLFLIPEKAKSFKSLLSLGVSVITAVISVYVYGAEELIYTLDLKNTEGFLSFRIDSLSKLIILFISLFTILILLYSVVYMRGKKIKGYFSWFLITLGCSYGAVLSDNLFLFLAFWGILGLTLYKLIQGNDEASSATAKKTLILIGASDSIMIIGIAILWKMTGSLSMSEISVYTESALAVTAFLALLAGSFTKAGAFPFHTWVPDFAKDAPASSTAYLPASLDKLLGIYFLARIINGLFIPGDWITLILLTLGVITIISAVMMALVQHNIKTLLGYHAVSQVGYMIIGLSLGSVIGFAAGIFHMINHAIYKSGLFMAAGSVEYRTGKDDLEELGGLSKAMPVTFLASIIFAMSISGIPPLNGFASKWMIYQAIIDFGSGTGLVHRLWIIWLGLAVLGSALTLASFIKFIGGIFLGNRRGISEGIREVPIAMWLPQAFLALLCIGIGVLASWLVVPRLLVPVSGVFQFTGFWDSGTVSLLIVLTLVLGVLIYFALNIRKFRTSDNFIGGEKFHDQAGYPATGFYKSLGEFRLLTSVYSKAQDKWFDIYELSKKAVLWFSHLLSEAHTGVLSGYIVWVFAGLIIMMLILI